MRMATVNWMLDEIVNSETSLGLKMLELYPRRDVRRPAAQGADRFGLGGGITGGGLTSDLRQADVLDRIEGHRPAEAEKVEALVLETLADLAETGIDPLTIEAGLNTIRIFSPREQYRLFPARHRDHDPDAATAGCYGRDPLSADRFDAPLAAIKARIASGERYFEALISTLFRRQSAPRPGLAAA